MYFLKLSYSNFITDSSILGNDLMLKDYEAKNL